MKESSYHRPFNLREELAHSVTHGIGIVFGIVGLIILMSHAASCGNTRYIVGCGIFCAALIILYSASTLYHGIQHPTAKKIFRIADHSAIYLLIAGTYTPFTLVNLQGAWGWSLLGVAWGTALLGIILQFTPLRKYSHIRLILYLIMGWSIIVAVKPLAASVPPGAFKLIAAGGLSYTSGVVFYLWRRLPYHHAIWHLFVLCGSVLHYFAVFLAMGPAKA